MFVQFLGRILSLALSLAPALCGGLLLLFLFSLLFARHPEASLYRDRRVGCVLRAGARGLIAPCAGAESSNEAAAFRREGATADAAGAFFVVRAESAPEGFLLTCSVLGPVCALLRTALGFLSSAIIGFFASPADPLRELKKTDPEAWRAGRAQRRAERAELLASKNPLAPGARVARAAARLCEAAFCLLPGYLLGCAIGAGISVALPDTFFPDMDFTGGLVLCVLLAIFGFLVGGSASAAAPIAAGLLFCGMGPGAGLYLLCTATCTNMTDLFRLGRGAGRAKTLLYTLAMSILSLPVCILIGDIAAAKVWDYAAPVIPDRPSELPGLWIGVIALAAVCLLALAAWLSRRRAAPRVAEGVRLRLSGDFGEGTEEALRTALAKLPGVELRALLVQKKVAVIGGNASFTALSAACAEAGLQLESMEE